MPGRCELTPPQRHFKPRTTLQLAVAKVRFKPRMRRRGEPGLEPGSHMRRPLRLRQPSNPIPKPPGLETVFAGESVVVEPQRPAAAAATADEKRPGTAVSETDVLEAHSEFAVREGDGSGRVVGADQAGGAQAGGADVGEIVDHCPHATKS